MCCKVSCCDRSVGTSVGTIPMAPGISQLLQICLLKNKYGVEQCKKEIRK